MRAKWRRESSMRESAKKGTAMEHAQRMAAEEVSTAAPPATAPRERTNHHRRASERWRA
jgi:hypothetical protein